MPTTYYDKFYLIDPGNPPPAGTALNVQYLSYTDRNDDGWLTRPRGDSINGSDITRVWNGDTITVNMGGSTVTITGVTFYTRSGQAYFTPTDGTNLFNATFVSSTYVTNDTQIQISSLGPPCFGKGTLIGTPQGPRPVEAIKPGDYVETLDNGAQRVLWVGRAEAHAEGAFAPVVFRKGSIGNDRELRVSQQHRMLLQGWQAELHFGAPEVLVPAKHLVNGDTIFLKEGGKVEYFHILLERHEVLFSNGVPSESFYPGDHILLNDRKARAELLKLLPGLAAGPAAYGKTARPTATRREAQVLALAA